MRSERAFRWLAYVNGALGVLVGCTGVLLIATWIGSTQPRLVTRPATEQALLVTSALLVLGLTYGFLVGATKHLRRPARRTALALAANTSVAIWFLVDPLLKIPALLTRLGPATSVLSLLIAFLAYRFVLRPAALATYAEPTGD